MKWVKATDRLPMFSGENNKVIVKGDGFVTYGFKNYDDKNPQMYYIVGNNSYCNNNVIWLDETE